MNLVRCKYSKCTSPPPSFYTWDALLGINIDLLFLFIDTLLFLGILVGMDSGFIQRHMTEAKYKAGLFFKVGVLKSISIKSKAPFSSGSYLFENFIFKK